MSFRLLPKDVKFFDLFIADGENLAAAAARAATRWSSSYDRLDERVAEIQALEKRGDEIDREINRRLEDAFVTPFDREDIHELVVAARRRRRRHPGDRRDLRDLRRRARRPTRPRGWRRSSPSRAVELSAALRKLDGLKDLEPHLAARSTARARGRRPVAGGDRRGCSATAATRSRSSSGATCTATSRTRSTPPRTPPRRSSGCTTRPADRRGRSLRSGGGTRSRRRGRCG